MVFSYAAERIVCYSYDSDEFGREDLDNAGLLAYSACVPLLRHLAAALSLHAFYYLQPPYPEGTLQYIEYFHTFRLDSP